MVDEFVKSIERFNEMVENAIKRNKIIETRSITFRRFVLFDNHRIPLGKIIIDDINQKIMFYETFCSSEDTLICIPTIDIIEFNEIIKCEFNEGKVLVVTNETDVIIDYNTTLDSRILMLVFKCFSDIIEER